jgi:hypothetical protein
LKPALANARRKPEVNTATILGRTRSIGLKEKSGNISEISISETSHTTKEETMGGRSDYIGKIKDAQRAGFEAGVQSGRQQILDMMTLVLNDKDIMGKDVFGKDRLVKVVKGIGEYIDKYEKAWQKDDEADYYQKKLDTALAQIYGEGMHDTFFQRYEFAAEYDYTKGRWK